MILQLFVTNYPAMFRVFQNSAMPAMPGDVFCLHSKYHDELFGDLQILHALLQGFSCVKLGKEMTGKRWWKCQCCLFFCQKKRKGEYFLDFISVCQRVKKNAWRNQLQLLPLSILNWTISNPKALQSCFFFQKQQFDDSCSTSTWMFCWNRGDTDSVHRWYDLIWL